MNKKKILASIGFIVFVTIWTAYTKYLVATESASSQFVPYPLAVVQTGYQTLFDSVFWEALLYSNYRVLTAFLLSILVGIPLGMALGWWSIFRNTLGPLFNFARYLPVAALVPLSIVIFGVTDFQKIIVLYIGTVFHVAILIEDAVARIPQAYLYTAKTMGFNKSKTARKVVFPCIAIAAYDASRVAMGLCWSYLLVAEIVASEKGVGYLVIKAQRFLQIENLYFYIIVLGIVGLLYDRVFVVLKPFLFPWLKS